MITTNKPIMFYKFNIFNVFVLLLILLIIFNVQTINAQQNQTNSSVSLNANNINYTIRNITLNISEFNKFLNMSNLSKTLNLSILKNLSYLKALENYMGPILNGFNSINYSSYKNMISNNMINIIPFLINSNIINSNVLCINCVNAIEFNRLNMTNIEDIIRKNNINISNFNKINNATNNLSNISFIIPINNIRFMSNFSNKFKLIMQNRTQLADLVSSNSAIIKDIAYNYTPKGFALINSTIKNLREGNASITSWSMLGNISSNNLNILLFKNIAKNFSNVTLSNSPYASAYKKILLDYLNNKNNTKIETYQIVYAISNITAGNDIISYIPTNITVLQDEGGTALVEINKIEDNISTHIIIKNKNIIIKNITINPKENAKSISTALQQLNNSELNRILPKVSKSILTSSINPIEYFYINTTLNDSVINYVNYTFNITKSFLEEHNINASYISLFRYYIINNTWIRLPTKIIGENLTNYIYRAESPGMSVYAIGYEAQAQTIPTNITNSTLNGRIQENKNQVYLYIIAVVAIAIGLLIVAYIMKHIKRNDNEQE